MRVLVDTSVWIEFFNRPDSPEKAEVDRLIDAGGVCLAGIVLAELLQGIRRGQDRKIVLAHFEKFPYEEMTRETWIDAGRLGEELDRKGKRTPLSDRALAVLCRQRGLSLYTLDAHFQRIDGLRLHLPIPRSH